MSRSVRIRLAFGALAFAIASAPLLAPVQAKDRKETKATAAVMKDLLACRGLPDDQRLACYDRATDAFDQAQKSGAVVVVDREQVQEAKKDVFGFNFQTFGKLFGGNSDAVNEVSLTVDRVTQDPFGKWTFYMDGGQVWHQIEAAPIDPAPHKGSQARIRRGAIGSYLMNVDGQSSIKVHRDE